MKDILGTWETRVVIVDGFALSPAHSQRVRNHSPDGFNWGYGGSGPAQLALGLLLHYAKPAEAQRWYQDFKFDVIARLPQADFRLPVKTVLDWIEKKRAGQNFEGALNAQIETPTCSVPGCDKPAAYFKPAVDGQQGNEREHFYCAEHGALNDESK